MELTARQAQLLMEKVNKLDKIADRCSVCHCEDWSVSDKIFELREFHGGVMVVGGSILPVIAMSCKECGYTKFLNAVALGIIPKEEGGAPK